MNTSRLPAVVAYVPAIGWAYVLLAEQHNPLAMFHVKQSIGLVIFLVAMLIGWAVITWVLAWIPYGFLVGNALFTVVIAAYVYGIIAWFIGIISALRGRAVLLPVFGAYANRL
jgi:uncharacterized membrane protein